MITRRPYVTAITIPPIWGNNSMFMFYRHFDALHYSQPLSWRHYSIVLRDEDLPLVAHSTVIINMG